MRARRGALLDAYAFLCRCARCTEAGQAAAAAGLAARAAAVVAEPVTGRENGGGQQDDWHAGAAADESAALGHPPDWFLDPRTLEAEDKTGQAPAEALQGLLLKAQELLLRQVCSVCK